MKERKRTYKAILAEVGHASTRSTLFWWLVDHHDELIEQSAGKRMSWHALCRRFAEHGLTDIKGRAATARTARETWYQARVQVAKARAQQATAAAERKQARNFPSRVRPEWRPTIVPQLPTPVPPRPASDPDMARALADPRAPSRDPDMTPEGQAILDAAWAGLIQHDRKKFGF